MYLKSNTKFSGDATEAKKLITLKQAQGMLGNSNKYVNRKTAKSIGLKINPVNMEPCDTCADCKSKQKKNPN